MQVKEEKKLYLANDVYELINSNMKPGLANLLLFLLDEFLYI